jgi:hypothetical protein
MAELAQTYVHLRPYQINVENIDRLGTVAEQRAVTAARQIYRVDVTIDIRLEDGSAKLWVTVVGAVTALHIGYGVVADYKGFKEGIVAICEDARTFGTFVSDHFLEDAGATPSQIYRVERRLKVPGRIKRVIAELERIENAKLSEPDLIAQLESVRQKLAQIEKELSQPEIDGLHQVFLHFENLTPRREQPPSPDRRMLPRIAIRPEQPAIPSGQQLVQYTDLHRVWHAGADHADSRIEGLTFHQRVFVPADDDDGGNKSIEIQPI